MPERAFRHALAASDAPLAVEIVERYVTTKLFRGEIRLVQRWLAELPGAWYASYPALGLAQAMSRFFTGQLDDCARGLDDVERQARASSEDQRRLLARVTAVRCFIACYHNDLPRAEALALQALQELPEEDFDFRGSVFVSLGDTYRLNARWGDARTCYLQTLGYVHAPVTRIESVHVFGALADLDLRQGRLRDAAARWRQALEVIHDRATAGSYSLPVIGWVYLRIAELLYERNELAAAWDHLCQGLERAELGGDARSLLAGYLLSSRAALAEGEVEAAAEHLERARPLLEQAPLPDWTSRFERCQLELWLAQNRLRSAVEWADARARDDERDALPDREATDIALARAWIAQGDQPSRERAMALLGRVLSAAEAEGRAGYAIEALALHAMALWQGGARAGAMTSLERALRLAEPEGYVRLFVDLGLPMAWLLQEARARQVLPEYVDRLLTACHTDHLTSPERGGTLPEPLSQREQEVLRLLAAGLTNREIAGALSISPETVKKHAASIYGKLGAGNRTEAVARARAHRLLEV
jgi:LuxR family maltose regulon positive regulatory protein